MAMVMQRYEGVDQSFDSEFMEQIILTLGDIFEVRLEFSREAALLTGACALAGGLIGSYAGGRLGAAVGAGLGGVTGYGVATMVSLREVWDSIKEQLKELLYIVFNYLRRLDPIDFVHAYQVLMASRTSKQELIYVILEFITAKLGREVMCNMIAA